MEVVNCKGTSNLSCNCNSWLDHWANFSNNGLPVMCSVIGCNNQADVGAHVRKNTSSSKFIIPLCKYHNSQGGQLSIKNVPLVSAIVSETCGR